MKTKIFFLIAVLVLGAVLTACGPASITVQTQPPQRTITVTGTGKVTLTPDIAYISIGVHTENASAKEAVSGNNTQAQAVIAAIKGFGVADKDIQTTNFSIYPQQQSDANGKVTGIIYVVDNTVYVTIRDLTKLGDLLDSTVSAGANNINSIQFDVADKTAALSQARLAAVADAKKQADELTKATGVALGEVQTISYYDSTAPVTVQYAKADVAAPAAASVPVQAGSMQIYDHRDHRLWIEINRLIVHGYFQTSQITTKSQTSPAFATGEVYNFRTLFPKEFSHADCRLHRSWPDGQVHRPEYSQSRIPAGGP